MIHDDTGAGGGSDGTINPRNLCFMSELHDLGCGLRQGRAHLLHSTSMRELPEDGGLVAGVHVPKISNTK